ncbi:hypothetical protein [Pseudobacter ginsenosidimutans]|jgi:hypothetical protein|uniref:Squalene-hopene cyclase-like protein n=1 Tax=Pseudobacter ginsenosidimutans TaxID=661488 RepID=A0A4Q7N3K9_9BACT|nr:hypothetical protein [Pseudobacter ginsenosidimutans]QEC43927.1 hypothetical protein FSB84_20420 [Pseudobacter ginsenosidimutans]RZS75358.1 hypothetical protein EV199_1223 [Pseudobacter ginsenosidimutans]
MLNLIRFNPQAVTEAVQLAEQFLLLQQDVDGCWRDYQLEPGSSEAWTTATVLYSLTGSQPSSIPVPMVNAAIQALLDLQRPTGWGYNRHTATDGDSTAWACRALASLQALPGAFLAAILQNYIHENGSTRTFILQDRFGSWADHHADVQPMIGMALLKCYASAASKQTSTLTSLIFRMRNHCILSAGNELWTAFWWNSDAYAIAINLEFLQTSGGIPEAIRQNATLWLMQTNSPQSAFEAAQLLKIALLCGVDPDTTGNLAQYLLNTQLTDGSWASAEVLLVPVQFEQNQHSNEITNTYADTKRLMSTAMAITSLKTILAATKQLMN